jgi:alpha-ribazole phosphatase
MINIFLLRHGKTLGKAALNGRTDVLVSEETQDVMATRLVDHYEFSQVVTSPLQRCFQLTERLVQKRPELNVTTQVDFRELDFGYYDGVPYSELNDQWETLEQFWRNPAEVVLPEAESVSAGYLRVTTAWQQFIAQCKKDTLVVAHGGTIRFILAYVLGIDWRNPHWYSVLSIGNQSISHLQLLWYEEKPYLTVKSIGAPL